MVATAFYNMVAHALHVDGMIPREVNSGRNEITHPSSRLPGNGQLVVEDASGRRFALRSFASELEAIPFDLEQGEIVIVRALLKMTREMACKPN